MSESKNIQQKHFVKNKTYLNIFANCFVEIKNSSKILVACTVADKYHVADKCHVAD